MIDIVEQIQNEIEIERLTRAALKPLPLSRILEAFPDEIKTARRERNRLRRACRSFFDEVRQIQLSTLDPFLKEFSFLLLEQRAPADRLAVLAHLEGLCAAYNALQPPKEGETGPKPGITAQMVDFARCVGIEGLFAWVKPRRIGRRFQACCPFHDESSGSFFVFADNKFKCFGCGEHGDAIDFVQKTLSMDFIEAVKYLNGRG